MIVLRNLVERKETILNSIEEQGKLTDELKRQINQCMSLNELEDIYLPYKPKKRTKAMIAREKGLQPLADLIMQQDRLEDDLPALPAIPNLHLADAELLGAGEPRREAVRRGPRPGGTADRARTVR